MIRGKPHNPLQITPKRLHFTASDILTKYKTYSVVGNAPIKHPQIDAVNDSDAVIRFNFPANTENTGERTDVVVMANFGSWDLTLKPKLGAANAIKAAKQIWFTNTVSIMQEFHVPSNENGIEYIKGNNWTNSLIWQHGLLKKNFIVPSNIYHECVQALLEHNGSDCVYCPSSGFLAVYQLMRFNPDAKINLFGFTHSGWNGHNWDFEKAYFNRLEKDGRLKRFL